MTKHGDDGIPDRKSGGGRFGGAAEILDQSRLGHSERRAGDLSRVVDAGGAEGVEVVDRAYRSNDGVADGKSAVD